MYQYQIVSLYLFFVSLIEKESTENQNIGLPILNSFQEGITIIYNGQNPKKLQLLFENCQNNMDRNRLQETR